MNYLIFIIPLVAIGCLIIGFFFGMQESAADREYLLDVIAANQQEIVSLRKRLEEGGGRSEETEGMIL